MRKLNRRQFGKWVLRGGILIPFTQPIVKAAVNIISPRGFPIAASGGGGGGSVASTVYWEESGGVIDAVTTSRTYNADQIVVAFMIKADYTGDTVTMQNSGTAQTWNSIAQVSVASNCPVRAWWCRMSTTQAMTITFNTNSGASMPTAFGAIAHTGAHLTDPCPSGKVFSNSGGADVSQSITPTSSGSCLWMLAGDWNATNTFAAIANCSLNDTFHDASDFTAALIQPTTQPRPDASAFTIGQTDTSGKIAWTAFEVRVP